MDRRVYKTKKNLKETLVRLMEEKPFEKISIRELCDAADTSRVTFYTYYGDKYDLLQEVFDDLHHSSAEKFAALQKENNPQNDFSVSLQNVLQAVMDSERTIFNSSKYLLTNSDTLFLYYRFLTKCIEEFELTYPEEMKTDYPIHQLNSFIAVGLWTFLHVEGDNADHEKTKEYARRLIQDLVNSNIFRKK